MFDDLGREVATLVNKEMQPGSYDIEFDAKNLAGGVYLYTLSSGRNIATKKFILFSNSDIAFLLRRSP
ncbi:MAG: hypothetical protein AAB209_02355 [Bacteroidota bacterium]